MGEDAVSIGPHGSAGPVPVGPNIGKGLKDLCPFVGASLQHVGALAVTVLGIAHAGGHDFLIDLGQKFRIDHVIIYVRFIGIDRIKPLRGIHHALSAIGNRTLRGLFCLCGDFQKREGHGFGLQVRQGNALAFEIGLHILLAAAGRHVSKGDDPFGEVEKFRGLPGAFIHHLSGI